MRVNLWECVFFYVSALNSFLSLGTFCLSVVFTHLQQAVEKGEQLCEGTHRLAEPVSNTTLNIWAGDPILISP